MTLSNPEIAELLAVEEQKHTEPHRRKAFRRASRAAYAWTEEAAEVVAGGRRLTELRGVGPWLARQIAAWLEDPPEVPEPPPPRRTFVSMAAATRTVAGDATSARAIRGDLQMHTSDSDGRASVMEMAEAAALLGHEYIAITDHSKGLKIAGGMDETELALQAAEIARVNEELAGAGVEMRVLRSIEMNINPRGEGDMDRDFLGKLDLVLGSFHSQLRTTEDQTDRYLAALRNPDINVLGHPRGRIYNFRLGLTADWPEVFAEARKNDKAIEIDCYPDRQDLDVELLALARDSGARISIGTDAHNPDELRFITIGIAAVIATGIPSERILNTMAADELVEWARAARG